MQQINIYEAEIYLSRLMASVKKDEEVVITRCGKPVARVLPVAKSSTHRVPGSAKGKFTVPPDFFKPLPDEILEAFEK